MERIYPGKRPGTTAYSGARSHFVACLKNLLHSMNATGVTTSQSDQCDSHSSPQGLIRLIQYLEESPDSRQLINKLITTLWGLTPSQTDALSFLVLSLSDSRNTSSGSIYTWLQFLSNSSGYELLGQVFGNKTTNILLRTAYFLSKVPNVPKQAVLGPSGSPWIPKPSVFQQLFGTKWSSNVSTANSTNLPHPNIPCSCNGIHSACLIDETAVTECTCIPNYLRDINGTCVRAPDKLVLTNEASFVVDSEALPGTPVGALSIRQDIITSQLHFTADIVPKQSSISVAVKDGRISLVLKSQPGYRVEHLTILIRAVWQYTHIDQVISIWLILEQTKPSTQLFQIFLLEGTRNGSVLADIGCSEDPLHPNQSVTYIISNSKPRKLADILFTLTPDGNIILTRDVNLLELSGSDVTVSLELSFEVRGQVGSSSHSILLAEFHILVIKDSYTYRVKENLDQGVVLQNRLLDRSMFQLRMSNLPKALQYKQGSIQLRHGLDYETERERYLNFAVLISTQDSIKTTSVDVSVLTVDVDDEPPVFLQNTYLFTVLNGTPGGAFLGILTASDPDTPVSELSYSLHGNNSQYFIIGAQGEITSHVTMNHARFGKSVNLTATVSDGTNSSVRDCMVNITIATYRVADRNLKKTFSASIAENSPPGTYVTSLNLSSYTNFHFREKQTMFKINSNTGIVNTLRELDRENSSESQTTFTVMAAEKRSTSCTGWSHIIVGTLHITLTDVNDNRPQFSSTLFNISVQENLLMDIPLFKTTIFDADEGENAKSHFTLTGDNTGAFSVNTSDGKVLSIWLHKPLDRESTSVVRLTVTALDGKIRINGTSATIHVTVLDMNDHTPIFAPSNTRIFNVSENVSPRVVGTLKATDADIGSNGNVSFILETGGMGYIGVGRHNGSLYTTRTLDRETISGFNLSIQIFDDGKPQRKSTSLFVVNVVDENDNAPNFTNSHALIARVKENRKCEGSAVLTVRAKDDDIDNNITYSMASNVFTIDSVTGEIRCKRSLDYETKTYYELTVIATDSGRPSRTSSVRARIEVQDVNDNKPVFSKHSYTTNFTLPTWRANKPILILRVTDKDSEKNSRVVFNIESRKSSTYFHLTSNVIRTSSNTPPVGNHTLNVTASDNETHPKTTSVGVIINVTSMTVNTPKRNSVSGNTVKFTKEYHFEVFENRNYSVQYKPIGTVRGSAPQGRRLTYSIVDNDPSGLFVVNATTGDLYYDDQLDREETDQYQLMVGVLDLDHAGWDRTLVTINVTDVNDNPPRFISAAKNLNISLMEDIHIDTEVVILNATDPDGGDNGNVTYSISPQTDFAIGRESGIITVAALLDADSANRNLYHLNITAADHGSPRLQSSMMVTVSVQDVNDNAPVFTSDRYAVSVMENTKNNTMVNGVVPLKAVDNDALSATNGWVIYQRNMTTPEGRPCPFYLTQDAKISVNGDLDFERRTSYSCIVTAYDMPTDHRNRKTATAAVHISVTDANDNAPVFQGTSSTHNINRDAAIDSLVTDAVTATDRDKENGNGDVLYSLYTYTTEAHYFRINPTTGAIRVQQPLYSAPRTIQVTVLATDQPKADKSLTTNTTITIAVKGYPRPQFTKSCYRGTVTEETDPLDSDLVYVGAWNPSGLSHCCNYTLQQSEFSTYFRVNSNSGGVRQVKTVDREVTGGTIALTVTTTGDGNTVGTSRAIIDITVQDINDNIPVFTPAQQIQTFDVAQESSVGHVIGNISSFDPDDPTTSSPIYRALKQNKHIDVDPSGSLIVLGSLIKPGVDVYTVTLHVRVSDGGTLDDTVDINRVVNEISTCQVVVRITQLANSQPPVFTQGLYTTNVSSTASRGQTVPIPGFLATDKEGTDVTYAILAGNIRDTFFLNASSGVLSLKYDVDSSLPDIINLTIFAYDSGVVQKSSACIVMIWVGVADTGPYYKNTDYIYPIVLGVTLTLLAVTVVAVIVLGVKLRTSRRLVDQLACTNTVLAGPADDTGLRMRYARPSVDRDYRDSRRYTSLMDDLRKIFYIETGSESETGEQTRITLDCSKYHTEPDYESIGESSADTYIDRL